METIKVKNTSYYIDNGNMQSGRQAYKQSVIVLGVFQKDDDRFLVVFMPLLFNVDEWPNLAIEVNSDQLHDYREFQKAGLRQHGFVPSVDVVEMEGIDTWISYIHERLSDVCKEVTA
ncbi:hypothetical protein [uncultured Gimesia sp.]|uniref:hypothetical protein n=1 Tax=uncultured Gimesia sp. TaxID=1678688 RepID=UPI002636EFAE|nr:hypothetical protein [uncultured Gimesia sp.]